MPGRQPTSAPDYCRNKDWLHFPRSRACSGHSWCNLRLFAPKPFTETEHHTVRTGHAEFEARRDPPRALDEMRGRLGRTDVRRSRREQCEPAVEMRCID